MAVVASFRDLADAEPASAHLEAAGIPHLLADTYTIGVAWYYSNALGGVRLHVADADAAEARALLETPAEVEWPDFPRPARDERCGACGQFALQTESGPRKTLAVMTAFGFPFWLWRSKLRCRSCGAAERVPFRFRPELLIAWALMASAVLIVIAILAVLLGYVVYGRHA
jgi:hypothetical protein